MALTRADVISGQTKRPENFSDFANAFAMSPYGEQLGRVVNEKSINQSIKNLILTNKGERPFQPDIGSTVNQSLFENMTEFTKRDIQYNIEKCLELNEPRANILEVNVLETNDPNEIKINIVYNVINNPEPINLNFILKRVR